MPNVQSDDFGSYAPTPAQSWIIALARASFLHRGAFRPSVSRLLSALRDGPIDHADGAQRFRLHHDDNAVEIGMLLNPSYNRDELAFLAAFLPPDGTFVDIGANAGLFSVPMALAAPQGLVIAVEPNPDAAARLRANLTFSGLKNVRLCESAIGDSDGVATLEINTSNSGGSRLAAQSTAGITVPVVTLAGLMNDLAVSRIHALKIDIEGYEDRALVPFFEQAPQSLWPDAIVIEHCQRDDWQTDCIAFLIDRGYREHGRTRNNLLLARR